MIDGDFHGKWSTDLDENRLDGYFYSSAESSFAMNRTIYVHQFFFLQDI